MYFYGQTIIKKELALLLDSIKNENNHNVMFRAPSGHGKTTLAFICIGDIGVDFCAYYLPSTSGEDITPQFQLHKRVHVIDEIHTLKNPEFLYPIMDSGDFTFFLLSNESGKLKEPLRNRCIQFIFHPYTSGELENIIESILRNFKLPDEFIEEVANRSKGNPRIAKKTCERLHYVLRSYNVPKDYESLIRILDEVLYIKEGGLNRHDEIYLDYLANVGGQSSLSNIISGTGIDRTTILTEIEPLLIYNGVIKITSRGRILTDEN